MEWCISLQDIKSTIQNSLYSWFTSKYSDVYTPIEFPFQDIILKDEWKQSIFFMETIYSTLLTLSYHQRTTTKTIPRRIRSAWLPDISVYLLSTLLFGGILIIEEDSSRTNAFECKSISDIDSTLDESFVYDIHSGGSIYFKGKLYSCDDLLKSVGNFVANLQDDTIGRKFDSTQTISINTDHTIENLILLIYSLLLGKTIQSYSEEFILDNEVLLCSDYLISKNDIWKPNYRPIHTVFIYSDQDGKIDMIAKPLKDSISIRKAPQSNTEKSISTDIIYTMDCLDRSEVVKKTYTMNHYLKKDRKWIRHYLDSISWKKIIWIPSQNQLQIIQSIEYNNNDCSIQAIPTIPIYQKLLLLLVLPFIICMIYWKPTETAKSQQLFWNYNKKTIWQDWLPSWIKHTFPYICWIWLPNQSSPIFAIGGKLIWGKWDGWSLLCFLIMFIAKLMGIYPTQIIHIRILDMSLNTKADHNQIDHRQHSIIYTSAKQTPYVSICQYTDKTYIYANIPAKITKSLRESLEGIKNESNVSFLNI